MNIRVEAPKALQVRTLSARVHGIDLDVDLSLKAVTHADSRTWEGTTSFPDTPRLMRLRLFCGDSFTEEVCFDSLRFPDDLGLTTVAIQLVPRPNGVWGRLIDGDPGPSLGLQFGAGLVVMWVAAVLYLRRVRRG